MDLTVYHTCVRVRKNYIGTTQIEHERHKFVFSRYSSSYYFPSSPFIPCNVQCELEQ